MEEVMKYSVIACKADYSVSVTIFESNDLNHCISLASACYQASPLSQFKVLNEDLETVVSFIHL